MISTDIMGFETFANSSGSPRPPGPWAGRGLIRYIILSLDHSNVCTYMIALPNLMVGAKYQEVSYRYIYVPYFTYYFRKEDSKIPEIRNPPDMKNDLRLTVFTYHIYQFNSWYYLIRSYQFPEFLLNWVGFIPVSIDTGIKYPDIQKIWNKNSLKIPVPGVESRRRQLPELMTGMSDIKKNKETIINKARSRKINGV